MYVFIDDINRTANVERNTITITDELQERINSCDFVCSGFVPTYLQEVKVYSGFAVLSGTINSVTLDKSYNTAIQNNLFRVGTKITVAINDVKERTMTVASVSSNSEKLKITFTQNLTFTPTAGMLAGVKVFAGIIDSVEDYNIGTLKNIAYTVSCLDFQRIFDKANINETYADRDARYIINDFCNSTINKNQLLDAFDYATDSAIRAVWIESGDGGNPTTDSSDYREGDYSGVLPWTYSAGTATFTSTPTAIDLSQYAGSSVDEATRGVFGVWIKNTGGGDIEFRIGSDSSNYAYTVINSFDDWEFVVARLKEDFSIVGNPNWTAIDYFAVKVTANGNGTLKLDGARIFENNYFKHYPYVQSTNDFDDFRVSRTKPTEVMQRLADEVGWYWYIDYDKYIRFFPKEEYNAPIALTENSNNFSDLRIKYDISRLVNKQIVEGGNETSASIYSEVREGDGIIREWIMKNKFKNLSVKVDKNTSTDTTEVGTNTTNIKATAHGLVTGDYIVNRTRSNAVRKITYVDPDNFTVLAVASQTSGDTFSKFVAVDVGVEGINDDASYNFMSNFNEKTIRNAEQEPVLLAGQFVLFSYNEVIPILVARTNSTSINNLINILGYTDGIFEGQKIVDRTLASRAEAISTAEAVLNKYSNVVITATFTTTQEGLKSGQLIPIKDTANGTRNLNQKFLIQKVSLTQREWGENIYRVYCSSLLFGMLELLQQLLKQSRKIESNEDEIINNIIGVTETLSISDILRISAGLVPFSESLAITDSIDIAEITPPFQWGPAGANPARWNLFQW